MGIADLDPGGPVDVLDAVDPAELASAQVVDFARDCFRARNQATARFLTALHEAGRTEEGRKGRRALLDEFSGDEAAAALGWSRAMACRWLDLADDLLCRLPEVHAAMRGGELEDTKARVVSDWTRDLADDHAHHVCTEVLPEAPRLPVGALIERIQQLAAALDPDWAARREQAAEKRARVLASRNPTGTANLAGHDLPLERAAVSMARLEALAARLRRRGVPIRIEALRAEVYLTLLDGTAAGLDDDTLLDLLTTRLTPPDEPDQPDGAGDQPPPGPDNGPNGGPDDRDSPDDSGPGDGPPGDGADDSGRDRGGPDGRAGSEGSGGPGDGPDQHGRADASDDDRDQDVDPGGEAAHAAADDQAPSGPVVRDGTVEVRLRLTTALGLDDLPAQIPRWGTALAPTARNLLTRYHHGEWRIVLTDDTGRLQHLLLARHRPHPPDQPPREPSSPAGRPPGPRRDRRRGRHGPAIVELQVPTTLLAALDPADHPTWAPLLTELHRRLPHLTDDTAGRAPDEHLDPAHATHHTHHPHHHPTPPHPPPPPPP
ncbi:DUF222 domain-containing protein, partial [Actinomycetospora straminea]|uniref:DUF222 domain-containing protein n=1 Tax=Actinomycetospora straminea TaxID=663607 RepID=UPI002366B715